MTTLIGAPTSAKSLDMPSGSRSLGAIVEGWWAAFRRQQIERENIAHLKELSDSQLRDIGITRAQIEEAVRSGIVRDRNGG